MQTERIRSTSEARRHTVTRSAVEVFARSGYATSPITQVAEHAGISSAYVMKLFPRKVDLFVAAIDDCYERIVTCLEQAADGAERGTTEELLDRMGGAYAELIADRDLLLLQVQALAAAQIPEVAEAVRRGTGAITTLLTSRARTSERQAQDFIARGQLCHLLTATGAFDVDEKWAQTLTLGLRHPA
ncbi:TetR/AcrR family transcriptional regulator [Luteipulveratus mongoliensis]|uniref:TetR family transcriptional regulator n=1 Tax=Luteipulveratus mongoliensis TaxID=571913 RepID=A0A0K1JDP0_9MICO|nr:TetR/AcrR family transcriptional regulator [Luteipulveratus mongoliensis]AKU14826.1 TetR family transcriptional regulator [Luteipulveratus mongoliensis]